MPRKLTDADVLAAYPGEYRSFAVPTGFMVKLSPIPPKQKAKRVFAPTEEEAVKRAAEWIRKMGYFDGYEEAAKRK